MAVGGLICCVFVIDSIGIPFLRLMLERTATELEIFLLDEFWTYFRKQCANPKQLHQRRRQIFFADGKQD